MTKKFLRILSLALALWGFGGAAMARSYDLVVAGAGTGGWAAAVQAARMGCSVALVEETGWIGGQMTAAGVTTLDDQRLNRSGLYGEFVQRLNAFYAGWGVNNAICYWGADVISGSADVEQQVMIDMLHEAGPVDIYLHSRFISVQEQDGAVTGLRIEHQGKELLLESKTLIDATEWGDIIPMTSAIYRAGNSLSPHIDLNASIQDITWTMPIRRLKGPVPEDLKFHLPPVDYLPYRKAFAQIVALDGKDWPEGYPYNLRSFNAYRAIPDPEWNLPIQGDRASTWGNVTATSLNWGNDYPGRDKDKPGLTVRYLEDRDYRRQVNARALERTLALLYYYQNDLGQRDWTVDTRTGYSERGGKILDQAAWIPLGAENLVRHAPPIPYVRESRRILGLRTLTIDQIRRDQKTGQVAQIHPSSIAVGEYPIDVHGSHLAQYLESDLGESPLDFPTAWRPGRFQVPLECLIPNELDGFLAAEKNISVSRMVNGSIRLHPITMLTGQAAGALAALSSQNGQKLREVPVKQVQAQLLKARSRLALEDYDDVPLQSPYWEAVQAQQLYGWLPPLWEGNYGLSFSVNAGQLQQALEVLFSHGAPLLESENSLIRRDDFRKVMAEFCGDPDWELPIIRLSSIPWLTRGEAAAALWDLAVRLEQRAL